MPVLMLKDGRWIVYFYGWVKGMKKKMREYFGRVLTPKSEPERGMRLSKEIGFRPLFMVA